MPKQVIEPKTAFSVVDLFSGAGGMSYGFFAHGSFKIIAAADAEYGKPSAGYGSLECNKTYLKNIGVSPHRIDLSSISPDELVETLGIDEVVDILSVCPPCTGFSRANPLNHTRDDSRNSLVSKAADFAIALSAKIIVMENARELIRGNYTEHFNCFRERLEKVGYNVFGCSYNLSRFGLPQVRERAIVLAIKEDLPFYTLDSMWDGWRVKSEATHVRRALNCVKEDKNADARFPKFSSDIVRRRISSIPKDGGSWFDLISHVDSETLLTGAMKRIVARNKFGSYPDVYGRMAFDRPAPTVKRECAHIGNGRYVHPIEDRLLSVEEMARIQGFPHGFLFSGDSLSNVYRHIGDAVPPLISYQLAHLCNWVLTDEQPGMQALVLPGTSLNSSDIIRG